MFVVPNLDEPSTRERHDLGDAEPASYLKQLPSTNQDASASRKGQENKQKCGGTVVHDQPVLGAGERTQQYCDRSGSGSAPFVVQ